MVQVLIETGRVHPTRWAHAFGVALRKVADKGAADDNQTYYAALADALGRVLVTEGRLQADAIEKRVEDWRAAYLRTPHGKPVTRDGTRTRIG